MKIAITCIQLIRDIEEYRQAFETAGIELVIPRVSGQHLEGEDLILALKDCSGVIAGDDQFTREVLSNCTKLEVISKWGIGIDGIDRDAASDLGITVTNTPGEFNEEVADVAMGYCIMLLRQLHIINASVKKGEWAKPAGSSLAGKSIGIIGLGGIGKALARRSLVAGMNVIGTDPDKESQDEARTLGVEILEFNELLSKCDVISINCPLTEETYHMFSESSFKLMNSGTWIINVGRGGVIDTNALVNALENGTVAGAALDVLEEEPIPVSSPLMKFPNVIFGSHNASNTIEASDRVHRRAIQNLSNELKVEIQL